MANNLIQIKRSTTTTANSTSPVLSAGELAFTQNGYTFWIGAPDGVGNIRVGGQMTPGTLTANQALVANSISAIDKVIVANLVPTAITANSSQGTAGQILFSNGTGGIYWSAAPTSVAGSDTQVQYNDGGVLAGAAGLTFAKTTNVVTIANTITIGGGAVIANASGLIANSTLTVSNATGGQITIANATGVYTTGTVNAASHTVGTTFVANTTGTFVNSTAFTITNFTGGNLLVANTSGVYVANSTGVVNAASHTVGTSTVANATGVYTGIVNGSTIQVGTSFTANATLVNAAAINVVGQTNSATLFVTTSANIGTAVVANASGVFVTNTSGTVNAFSHTVGTSVIANGSGVFVTNSTGIVNSATIQSGTTFVANSTRVTIGAVPLYANSSQGTAGQVLTSNAAGVFWNTPTVYVSSVATGNGLTGGPITSTGTVSVLANSGIVSNATGTYVLANNGIIANSFGVFADGANGISVDASGINVLTPATSGLTSNTTGVYVNAGNGISVGSNVSVNPGSTLTVNTTGVHVNSTLSITDLTLSGNLTVSGTLTTVDTTTLRVKDNLIELADSLASTTAFLDNVDSGFFLQSGNTSTNFYSGLARIAGSSTNTNPYFKLFSTTTAPNSTIIDTGATTGTLQAYLLPYGSGGAFVANAANVQITANNTVGVNITANSVTLSTALGVGSGGTGLSSLTSGAVLFGNSTGPVGLAAVGANGTVLQVTNNLPAFGTLDGGTF